MNKTSLKKILIVEDDQWLADSYALILKKNHWQVAVETKATKAIDAIDDFRPDIILLDYMLPDKNAPTLLNELQSHVDTAELPIVLCTSLTTPGVDEQTLRQYGVRAVLDKKLLTPDVLLKKVNTFFTHATDQD